MRPAVAMIAALYVETDGAYFGLPDVDPWDEKRDARRYAGPWSVVAHPPCSRWCRTAGMIERMYGYRRGDDGGTFAHALAAVRRFGGVLEHPAHSLAWKRYGLPRPMRGGGWVSALGDPGWSCWIDQGWFGHTMKKPTWLYVCGVEPPVNIEWGVGPGRTLAHREPTLSATAREKMTIPTPPAFRDFLISLARTAQPSLDVLPELSAA